MPRARSEPPHGSLYVQSALLAPNSTVLFVGDGTNDAVALAQASIGMHVNEGTDIAQSAADAILMRLSLKGIVTLIDLSEAFWKRVVFNFVSSAVYNVFAILLAAGAFLGTARIPPQNAGVVLAAAGLKWKKF